MIKPFGEAGTPFLVLFFCSNPIFLRTFAPQTNTPIAMPANRNAMLRYRTIDRCLSNRYRRWTLDDLIQACSDALYEYEGISKGISRRTIQLDLQTMRSDRLGYNAPITVVDGKYYTYSDPDYSILHSPLTEHDMGELADAVEVLKQMTGFSAMAGLADLVTRLDDHLSITQKHNRPLILMESNEQLKGLEFLPVVYDALRHNRALKILYQSFRASAPSEFVFYPYVLKEFNNRWFVPGRRKDKPRYMYNLALDRFEAVQMLPDEPNIIPPDFDVNSYFGEMIGVSRSEKDRVQQVLFWATPDDAPYIATKPFHSSQTIVETRDDGYVLFRMDVIINRELIRALLGFGAGIRVAKPSKLARLIHSVFKKAEQNYSEHKANQLP